MRSIGEYNCEHADLMMRWKEKYPDCGYFTEDGIVNPAKWFEMPEDKRIVFLLKEAYTGEDAPSDWNEAKWLNGDPCRENCEHREECLHRCPVKGNSFNRIAEWIYCITELPAKGWMSDISSEELLDHVYWLGVRDKEKSRKENNAAYREKRAALLKKIAVVNLKKADGEKHSDAEDMKKQTDFIKDMLLEQLELIQPHYVVCCGTWGFLDEKIQDELREKYEVIRTPHPNAHVSRAKMLKPVPG